MPLSEKNREWLRLFHLVVSGRATVEECNELGVTEEQRREYYNARYAKRLDAMRRRVVFKFQGSEEFSGHPESPMDAIIEMIDRKKAR